MHSLTGYYRFLFLLLLPFALIFSVLYLSTPISDSSTTGSLSDQIFSTLLSSSSTPTTTTGSTTSTTTTTATTTTSTTSTAVSGTGKSSTKAVPKCVNFTIPDERPFFDREPQLLNPPRLASNISRKSLLRRLRSLRLAAIACAFNVEKEVDKFRAHVEPIVDLFHPTSRILILESDSTDKTYEKLRQWGRAEVYSYGNLSIPIPRRTERIAYCRNELLNKARAIQPDYMLILDLDIFATNVSSFLSNFDYNTDDWSVMTANLLKEKYYDIWALRTFSETIMNFDCWHRVWALGFHNKFCLDQVIEKTITIHQKPLAADRPLIEVRSAFDGAAIYKMDATEGCSYSGDYHTCEHAPFHICMRERNQARIFINPKFMNE